MTVSNSICALIAAVAVIITAVNSYEQDLTVTDMMIKGCDSFGYTRMADEIRDARATGTAPDFFIHDDQTRWLIAKFKESGLPVGNWDEVVAAHAHHYFPGSDQVAPQYPPGTGWVMSLFPKPNALLMLDKVSIILVSIGGILLIVWCAAKGLPMSGLMMAGAAAAFLSPYEWMGSRSFSINATIFPLFLGSLLAWIAININQRNRIVAPILALGSGLIFGLVIQTRIASFLLLPAIALIFLPGKWRLLFWYVIGLAMNGIVPLMYHSKLVTGSFFTATYNNGDKRQGLECVQSNLLYYSGFISEDGCHYVIGLFLGTLLFIGAIAVTSRGIKAKWKAWLKNHYGLAMAPFVALLISTAYFLTHPVVTSYYPLPCMLLASLLFAFLFTAIEMHWQKAAGNSATPQAIRRLAVGATALIAFLLVVVNRSSLMEVAASISKAKEPPVITVEVPPELLRSNAWIWSDLYSSTIVYYAGHPSFKLPFANSQIKKLMYRWIKDKGDFQYMVIDSDTMKTIMTEAQADGWSFTPVGQILDATCYKMEKP